METRILLIVTVTMCVHGPAPDQGGLHSSFHQPASGDRAKRGFPDLCRPQPRQQIRSQFGYYKIERRIGSGAWTVVHQQALYADWSEFNPQPQAVYAYRMRAYDRNGQLVASSNVDLAMLVSFTDDPLRPLMVMKAQHIKELVDATNVLRASAGLSSISQNEAASGNVIRASHLTSILSWINEARVALGAPALASPPGLEGGLIRMQHIQDLREAMR